MHTLSLVAGCLTILTMTGLSPAQTSYTTGFEAPDFTAGPLPQQQWLIDSGSAEIIASSTQAAAGQQFLQLDPQAVVHRTISATAITGLWLQTWLRGTSSIDLPDPGSLDVGSTFIGIDPQQGFMALDGDGQGGCSWQVLNATPGADTYHQVSIYQDYSAHTWNIYLDRILSASGLGFRDNSISVMSGMQAQASQQEALGVDDVYVGLDPPPGLFDSPTATPTTAPDTPTPTATTEPDTPTATATDTTEPDTPTATPTQPAGTATPTPSMAIPSADFNGDGIIDDADLLYFMNQWHTTEPTP